MSETGPTIADATGETRTVPAGPSQAGEPDRPSGAAGGTPCAGRVTRLVEFVGGPSNGYARAVREPVPATIAVPDVTGGIYVTDLDGRAARWHVPGPIADQPEQLRPAPPVEHVRPADTSADQVRPARRSNRSGRPTRNGR